MPNFFSDEKSNQDFNLTGRDIANSLTLDDVYHFLLSLGINDSVIEKNKTFLCLPTYCHNSLIEHGHEHKHKLYWYDNNKCFHCYTECDESMSIFTFYKKFIYLNNNEEVSYYDSLQYVKQFVTHNIIYQSRKEQKSNILIDKSLYERTELTYTNSPICPNVLDCFIKCYPQSWIDEGISEAAMDRFDIRYSIQQQKIIIPHYDIDGQLIGIRGRTLNPDELEDGCKYMPIMIGDKLYNHKLSQNLYGINESKKAIKKFKRAIIAEGEKAALKGFDYDGENNIIVACCGHNINIYQVNLLVKNLGVNEIVIAFDKEYDTFNSDEGRKDINRTIEICNKYKNKCAFSYIIDYKNLLNRKDSPVDRGQEVWNKLYSSRVKLI